MTNGPPPSAPHGTVSAYKRHLRHHEPPCEACRQAWAAYHRDRYQTIHQSTPATKWARRRVNVPGPGQNPKEVPT